MTRSAIRPYCGVANYPGKKPFLFGSVAIPADARHDEIVTALLAYAAEILPPGLQLLSVRAGSLFFVES